MQDNVIFAGQQNNVNEWMQSFDIFVMPSLYEGLPFVLVEAQAAGLPCVVSDSVNKDACILDTFCFKSLNDSPSDWADLILENAIIIMTEIQSMSWKEQDFLLIVP